MADVPSLATLNTGEDTCHPSKHRILPHQHGGSHRLQQQGGGGCPISAGGWHVSSPLNTAHHEKISPAIWPMFLSAEDFETRQGKPARRSEPVVTSWRSQKEKFVPTLGPSCEIVSSSLLLRNTAVVGDIGDVGVAGVVLRNQQTLGSNSQQVLRDANR